MKTMKTMALSCVLAVCAPGAALAVNKCLVDGKVVYQDQPCKEAVETVAEGLQRKERQEELHRRLDQMAARGVGLVQHAVPAPAPPREPKEPRIGPIDREGEHRRTTARIQQDTIEKNARSAAALTTLLEDTQKACGGGKLPDYPVVGMSDETFRTCTLHARFGGITQVVVAEDGKVPLRLYIFPTAKAQRVYSIGGVVTAVRP